MSSNVVTSSGNAQEEVGISPVLLQAITHTLSSSGNASWMKKEQLHHSGSIQSGDGVHHLVIRAAPPDGSDAAVKVENGGEQVIEMESEQQAEVVNTGEDGQETYIVLQQHDIDGKESQNLESIHIPSGMRVSSTTTGDGQPQVIHVGELPKTEMVGQPVQNGGVVVSDSGLMNSEMNMSGVLSAIASHLKNKKQQVKLEKSDTPIPISICPSEARVVSEDSTVTYRYSNGASVSSPGTDITVADIENVCQETVTVSDGVHMDDQTLQRMPIARMVDIPQEAGPGETMIILQGSDLEMSTLQLQQSIPWKTMQIVTSDQEVPPEMKGGCPICGDKISGYHYGIYSCESCKGFFKRTVQNKKAFMCHRKGECEVNIANRKKCPACRFTRCLVAGMKLEAIREDRTRGGRSSYGGASPQVRTKPPPKTRTPSSKQGQTRRLNYDSPVTPSKNQQTEVESPSENKEPDMTSVVTMTVEEDTRQQKVLEDLLAVEVLMADDEEEQSCCNGKLTADDADIFTSLLHFADHSLYKIVRWARNLPDFAKISTDDQILLLQNCWSELLFVTWCWRSVTLDSDQCCDCLRLPHGRLVDLAAGQFAGLGEVMQRLLSFTDTLQRLQVDAQEILMIKVVLLFSPDVKDLHEEVIVWNQQDELVHLLHLYMRQHYPGQPNKLYQVLACLADLTRTCMLAKEHLTARQAAGEVPHYSLLSELLKGDITVS